MSASLAKRWFLLSAAILAIVAAGGGVAYATGVIAHAPSQVIVGCAKTPNGQLRIVDNASQCLSSENAVTFAAPAPPSGPTFVGVDCNAGQSLQQAIDQADPNEPLTVNINGTCNEQIHIGRDDVTLNSASPDFGIQAPVGGFAALSLNAARRITLNQLTLAGGQNTISAFGGSSFTGGQLRINSTGDAAVTVQLNSSGQLNNPTVVSSGQSGVSASGGGSVVVQGGTITSSGQTGVSAQQDGSVAIFGTAVHGGNIAVYASFGGAISGGGITVDGASSSGVMAASGGTVFLNGNNGSSLIDHNGYGIQADGNGEVSLNGGIRVTGNSNGGIIAFSSGALQLQGVTVDNNSGNGVTLANASSADIHGSTISGNANDGINLLDTSVAQFDYQHGTNTVTNNGRWGVFCESTPGVAMIRFDVGTVSGNTAGQNNCPVSAP